MYTAYDLDERVTQGVQTTLAGTILAAGYLAGVTNPTVLLAATLAFTYLMITEVTYPELHERDAVAMGGVQFVAIIAPMALGRVFPRLLLAFALAYLLLAPWFYWRDSA
jgi:CDP-diacylglycerol--serine O-phosphatidyltransferase